MNREHENYSLTTVHRSSGVDWAGALLAGILVAVFCFVLLWHDPFIFWNDDYELSILPVFTDVARSWHDGQLPLLSPYSWVCSNLAGEFQYGTFSVFVNAAVVLIWKFPLKFAEQAAALSITHLFVLAAGAFLLARGRRLSVALSMLVAVVATLSGWVICWGATDWFGALGAFTWLPWCWWALERSLACARDAAGGRNAGEGMARLSTPATSGSQELVHPRAGHWLGAMIWPAPFVYLLVTGGFPYTVVMLGLLVAWICVREICGTRQWRTIVPTLAGVALGFALSAPAWLALLDYVRGSNRFAQSAIAHWQWLVPPSALPGFVLPSWTVNWADFSSRYRPHAGTELACGLVPTVALLWGLIFRGREFVRKMRWELGLLIVVCALSMLPSAGVFRWSFRWLPFLHLIMVLCAAEALRLSADSSGGSKRVFRGVPVFALVLVTLTVASSFLFGANGRYTGPLAISTTLMVLAWMAADLSVAGLREWAPSAVAFGVLLSTYLIIPPNCGVPKYNLSQDLLDPRPLDPSRLYLSVYPPAEVIYRSESKLGPIGQVVRPGSTSMLAGLKFVNGYSPILAGGVAKEFGFAIHGEFDWAMQKRLLETVEGDQLLSELGVDGIVVASESGLTPRSHEEWEMVFESEEGRIYHRRSSAHDPGALSKVETRMSVTCPILSGTEGKLVLFSRPFFPGYSASLDGHNLAVTAWRGLVPAVEVPSGANGRLVLTYRPWWLVWGGGISLFSAVVFIACVFIAWRRRRTDVVEAVVPTA